MVVYMIHNLRTLKSVKALSHLFPKEDIVSEPLSVQELRSLAESAVTDLMIDRDLYIDNFWNS